MAHNNYFQFKQFRIVQEKAAMKVGIDGVLLGAWVNTSGCKNILDIGTGTGLIALMLAQRSKARITAVEIEKNAAFEAKTNVAASPWKERIDVKHTAFQEFAKESTQTFDLIVSNPPYFCNAPKAVTTERSLARHNDALPFSDLIEVSATMLNESGRLALIVPFSVSETLKKIASSSALNLHRITEIKPNNNKPANRVLLEWGKKETALEKDCLTIYDESNVFSSDYIELTKAFYLKF